VRDPVDELLETIDELCRRVVVLVRSIDDPSAVALPGWSVGDVAVHVSQATIFDTYAVTQTSDPQGLVEELLSAELLTDAFALGRAAVADMNASFLERDRERDVNRLADRIEERWDVMSRSLAQMPEEKLVPWLGGVQLPVRAVACHLAFSEWLMHGHDIARAMRTPWPIEHAHALLFFEGAALPILSHADPRAFVDQREAKGLSVAYKMKLRGGSETHLRIADGALTVGGDGPVDCTISADPVGAALVMFGRRSLAAAVLRGQMAAWGHRPWLALKLPQLLLSP
jgi:hypothetical protein